MAKVLLVEDDNNLREIFEMRLQAEGYQTLTAGDGEEGLTVAMKEKPDLIIADVMMPKLSGFDMLETLRAAPEMKNVKVIMMTALGQAEDQERGKSLGVIKYLVKSQATLEDFARTVKEVMPNGDTPPASNVEGQAQNNQESENKMQEDPSTNQTPSMPPAGGAPAPASDPMSPPQPNPVMGDSAPADTGQMSASDQSSNVQSQINDFVASAPGSDSAAPASDSMMPAAAPDSTDSSSTGGPDIPVATPPADSAPAAPEQSETPPATPTDTGMPTAPTPPAA